MFCKACGHDGLDAESRVCPACGAAIEARPAAAGTGESPPDDPTSDPPAPASTSIDVEVDVGELSGGSKAVGVEVGELSGGLTVNQAPEQVEGDFVRGDKVVEGDHVGGDDISASIGNVGAGAQIAVGKQIQQSGAGPAGLSAAERATLEADLAALSASIDGLDLADDKKLVGREFLSQLGKAMLNEDAPPEASTIQVLGDWLLENLPGIEPGLSELFGSPAGRRVLALAGESAQSWSAARFE